MRAAQALKYLSMILIGLVSVLILLAFNLDFGRFKPQAESLLSNLLDRSFTVDGPLHLTLDVDGRIALQAGGLHLAGADWSPATDLVQLDALQVRVDLWSVFRDGPVLIEWLSASGLRIHFEEDAQGRNNWTLLACDDDEEEEEPDSERFQLPVLPTDIRISDALVSYTSPDLAQPLILALTELREVVRSDREIVLNIAGSINDTPLQLEISSPQVENLVDLQHVQLNLKGSLSEISLDAELAVDDLLSPARPTASINLKGPSVDYLLNVLKMEQLASGPLYLLLKIAPAGEHMGLQLDGAFGEFTVASRGHFSSLQTMDEFDYKSSVAGPDLRRFGAFLGVEHLPPDPFTFHSAVKRSGKNVHFEQLSLRVDQATLAVEAQFDNFPNPAGRGTAQLDVPDIGRFSRLLRLPGKLEGPLSANASVNPRQGGRGAAVAATATSNGMTLEVDGHIDDNHRFVGSALQVDFRGPKTETLAVALGLDEWPAQAFSVQLNLARTATGIAVGKSQAVVGDDRLDLEGTVGNKPLLEDTSLGFELAGPSLASILQALDRGLEKFPHQPYRVKGRIQAVDGKLKLNDVVATVGKERAVVSGTIAPEATAAGTELKFELRSPDLKQALAGYEIAVEQLPGGKLGASGVLRGGGDVFILDGVLIEFAGATARVNGQFAVAEAMNGTSLQLDISGSDFAHLLPSAETRQGLARPFTLKAQLGVKDKFLIVDGADFQIDQTRLQLDTRLGLDPMLGSASFSLSGSSPDLLPLTPNFRQEADVARLPMSLNGEGVWEQSSLTLKNIELKLAKSRLHVDGTLSNPPNFDRTNLVMSGAIPDLSRFSHLAGNELPVLPVQMKFNLLGSGDEIRMKDFSASVGESDLVGDFTLKYSEVPELKGAFRSRYIDVTPFLPPAPEAMPTKTRQTRSARKEAKIIPDIPIPMEALEKFVATIRVDIDEFVVDAHATRNVDLDAEVAGGALTVHNLNVDTDRGGRLQALGSLRPTTRGGALMVRVKGSAMSFGLPATTVDELQKLPQYDLNMALVAEGSTVRELAAGASGYLKAQAGEGRYKAGGFRMLTNDFIAQLAETLDPFATQDPYVTVNCAAVLAAVEGGELTGKPIFVLSSDRLNIFANADVDLATEKLNLTFNTVPQKGLGLSLSNLVNPYIMVIGTLANPVLSLDPESTLIQGGAAVATGGLSILAIGFKDRYLSSKDPCGDAYREADKGMRALEKKYGGPAAAQ